jgi:hypothetical protein
MDLNERVMRVMAHVNIGAALAVSAWVVVSGLQIGLSGPPVSPAPAPTRIDGERGAWDRECGCVDARRERSAAPDDVRARPARST